VLLFDGLAFHLIINVRQLVRKMREELTKESPAFAGLFLDLLWHMEVPTRTSVSAGTKQNPASAL
jgi:hypothetical protein